MKLFTSKYKNPIKYDIAKYEFTPLIYDHDKYHKYMWVDYLNCISAYTLRE